MKLRLSEVKEKAEKMFLSGSLRTLPIVWKTALPEIITSIASNSYNRCLDDLIEDYPEYKKMLEGRKL